MRCPHERAGMSPQAIGGRWVRRAALVLYDRVTIIGDGLGDDRHPARAPCSRSCPELRRRRTVPRVGARAVPALVARATRRVTRRRAEDCRHRRGTAARRGAHTPAPPVRCRRDSVAAPWRGQPPRIPGESRPGGCAGPPGRHAGGWQRGAGQGRRAARLAGGRAGHSIAHRQPTLFIRSSPAPSSFGYA